MNISETFSIETCQNTNTNGQIRFFQKQTCIIASIFGLSQTSLSRANEAGILEVSVKMEEKNDMQIQRHYEVYIRNILEPIINLQEHPNKVLKLVLVIASDDGSILSAFLNAAFIVLLQNGISLKKSIFAQQILLNNSEDFILYPNKKQLKDNGSINVVLNVNSNEIHSIQNENNINLKQLKKITQFAQQHQQSITNLLKTHIYNNLQTQSI